MKRICLLLMMSLTALTGYAESSALIKANNTSIRTDIFEEFTNGGLLPPGFADLRVTATLKTHKPGIYSAKDIHGTTNYKLLLNVDGQAVKLRGSLQKENSEPRGLVDPEAGDGIRYRFSKSLRLRAGIHRIVVSLPDDGIAVEREMTLVEGDVNNLALEPIYSTTAGGGAGAYSTTSFKEGIRGIRLTLNGHNI